MYFKLKKMYICSHKLNITLSEKQGVEPDELSNTDSIHIFIQTKNRYKKANIDYIIIRENAPITYFGYYRSLDCRYYSHDILLYVKKDMERKKRNIFVDKFILIKCKFQIYIQEIKSKKMF